MEVSISKWELYSKSSSDYGNNKTTSPEQLELKSVFVLQKFGKLVSNKIKYVKP